jgi:transcription termination factor Rho
MSVDSNALERSALEGKDRDELVTIAQALGGKPAARASKATIVNLILELTGVSEAAPAKPARATKKAAAASAAPAPEAEAPAAEPAAQEAAADDDAEGDDDGSDEADGDDRDADGGQQQGRGQGGGQRQDAQGGDANGNGNGNGNGGGGQQGGAGADDDEDTGNRRRRRRGRNRDRQGEQGQGGDEWVGEPVEVEGLVDLRDEGYGFVRVHGFLPSRDDAYVSVKQARQFGLRRGDHLTGASRPPLRNEKNPALLRIDSVNGRAPDESRGRPRFDDLTPVHPDERLRLEHEGGSDPTARIVDLVAPIGKGQRGLIVSPPKAGKTTLVEQIALAIEANHPDVQLFVVLVDERPEEVTELRRLLDGESTHLVASTFDRPAEEHAQVAELVLERAKRLVEEGTDVVILLDGATRLARAYDQAGSGTGRVTPGGIDVAALYPPKRYLGAARNAEEGGSLTILATCQVGDGTRADDVIFESLAGTENLELRLDRRLADRRLHPAIDIDGSSTRHEDRLFEGPELERVGALRRALQDEAASSGRTSLEVLLDRISATRSNDQLLAEASTAK